MAQKPSKRDDVTFLTPIFGIFNCRASKQMTLLEYWDKTGQDRYVLKRNFWAPKFNLFDLSLDLTCGWDRKMSVTIELYVTNGP